jgi:hypothetical protein
MAAGRSFRCRTGGRTRYLLSTGAAEFAIHLVKSKEARRQRNRAVALSRR